MALSPISWNLPLSVLTSLVLCIVVVNANVISATSRSQSEVPAVAALNKRDVYMGLKMQCKTHARNCPGSHMLKRKRLVESPMDREYVVSAPDIAPSRERTGLTAGQNSRNSLYAQRDGLRFQLMDLLRRLPGSSSDKNTQLW